MDADGGIKRIEGGDMCYVKREGEQLSGERSVGWKEESRVRMESGAVSDCW